MAMRCRCPPDRATPRSPITRVVAVGQGGDELVGLGGTGRRLDVGLRGIGAAVGDVLADGAAEQHGLLQHDADMAAQALQRHVAHVVPVDAHRARP